MRKDVARLFYESTRKPVWIMEKQHKRGVRTPTTHRFGKHFESTSGKNLEVLKMIYNAGLKESDFNFEMGGVQHGFYIG